MWPFDKLGVRLKLALLVGVPVAGALILSALIALDARQRAASAAALGSITDLAELSAHMSDVVHDLQVERAETALAVGKKQLDDAQLGQARQRTDAAMYDLSGFLARRNLTQLPPRLARDLDKAQKQLAKLPALRSQASSDDFQLDKFLEFYSQADESLIGATAALTQLSNDGQLLRSISTLVTTMELLERASREHALLSYVFARDEFPPGTFREFVTLVTEEEVYIAALRNSADDEDLRIVEATFKSSAAREAAALRKKALETSDDSFQIDPNRWFKLQGAKMDGLRRIEAGLASDISTAASDKIAQTQKVMRRGLGLAAAVLLVSTLLGSLISRGLTKSVRLLADAAEKVQKTKDYAVRAEKVSSDEIGLLSDAFNEMLAGIQERDRELRDHRENLEKLVEERTRELWHRNEQMRLVLDNVEQGLVMIDSSGKLSGECSAAFERWFGKPAPGQGFAAQLSPEDGDARGTLELGYEQLMDDFMPIEVSVDQMPKRLVHGPATYSLMFTPIEHEGKIDGALLVVRDITRELLAQRAEAMQREQIRTFERVMRDKLGFIEFFSECRALIERITENRFADNAERLRVIHTVKGNTALFDVSSVSTRAHRLEQAIIDAEDPEQIAREIEQLDLAWDEFASQIVPLLGENIGDRLELTKAEFDEIVAAARARVSHAEIEHLLVRLQHEPARVRFQRVEHQLKGLAKRLGKDEPLVLLDPDDVRLPPGKFQQFWSAFAHVVRNVVDHGFESSDERKAKGKSPRTRVELRARSDRRALTLEIKDDGRGVDWERLREKAREHGLPHETQADLVAALLHPGVSAARQVTENSGRGVGMAAVVDACHALNGEITVESRTGEGTLMRFVFPSIENDMSLAPRAPRLSMAPLSHRPSRAPSLRPSVRPSVIPSA